MTVYSTAKYARPAGPERDANRAQDTLRDRIYAEAVASGVAGVLSGLLDELATSYGAADPERAYQCRTLSQWLSGRTRRGEMGWFKP